MKSLNPFSLRRWGPGIALAAIAAVYALLLPRNHTEAEDALGYIYNVTTAAPQLHPNHLLFEPMHSVLFSLWQLFGYGGSAELPMQIATLGFTLVMLALVYVLTRRRSGQAGGLAAVAGCAALFGVGHYGLEAETYIPPLVFLLAALVRFDDGPNGPVWGVQIGLLLAAAVLLHQMFIFAVGAVVLAILVQDPRSSRAQAAALSCAVTAGTVILGVYVAAFLFEASGDSFMDWAKGYAKGGLWDPPSLATPVKAVIGFLTAAMSINWLFALPGSADFFTRHMPNTLLFEEIYTAQTAISLLESVVIVLALSAVAAATLWLLFKHPLPAGRATALDRLLVGYASLYAILACLWEPMNREFWIHVWVILIVWSARRFDWRIPRLRAAWGIAAAGLFIANLLSAFAPYTSRESDFWYQSNLILIRSARPEDRIVTECGWICLYYLKSYSAARVLLPSWANPDALGPEDAEDGGRLILSSWAIRPLRGLERQLHEDRRAAFFEAFEEHYGPLPEVGPATANAQELWVWSNGNWISLTEDPSASGRP